MYQQALEIVMENGSASASMLQRRLRVGYNRAANLVEEMERHGIVGPAQGSKPRKVLARPE
jgi:S-DNA-T family DNA segregation ATPase FtsK/SpoIIIE